MRIAEFLVPLAVLSLLYAAAPRAGAEASGSVPVSRDWQTVLDLSGMDLAAFTHASPGRSWIIARIAPAGDGPTQLDHRIDSATLTRDGTISVEAVLFGDPGASQLNYHHQWQEPARQGPWFDPFRYHGGTAVLLVDPVTGFAEVEESYLLPAEWVKSLVAAMEYFRGHEREFQDPPAGDERKALLERVGGDNPVLAVAAARILAKSRDGSLLRAISRLKGANAQALRVATLMNIALKAAPDVRPREAADLLGGLFAPPCNAEQLRGAALGMLAARSGGGPTITRLVLLGVSGLDAIDHLILADRIETTIWMFIRQRQAALDAMHDPYLNDIFSRIGHDCTER